MLRRSQIASRSLYSSSCSSRFKKTCVLPPTSSAKPESLRGAIASPNLRPRPLCSTPEPTTSEHLFGSRLAWTLDEFHIPSELLLHPVLTLFVFSTVSCVQPQLRETGKLLVRFAQSSVLIPS